MTRRREQAKNILNKKKYSNLQKCKQGFEQSLSSLFSLVLLPLIANKIQLGARF